MVHKIIHPILDGVDVTLVSNGDAGSSFPKFIRQDLSKKTPELLTSRFLSSDETFVDIGAGIGTFSLITARLTGASGLAIEADTENYDLLCKSVFENQGAQVYPVQGAALDRNTFVYLRGSEYHTRITPDKKDKIVRARNASQLISANGFDDAALLKINVAGSELDVLVGLHNILNRKTLKTVVFAVDGAWCFERGVRPQEIIGFLGEYGFQSYVIYQDNLIPRDEYSFQEFDSCWYLATRHDLYALARDLILPELPAETRQSIANTAFDRGVAGYHEFMKRQLSFA